MIVDCSYTKQSTKKIDIIVTNQVSSCDLDDENLFSHIHGSEWFYQQQVVEKED